MNLVSKVYRFFSTAPNSISSKNQRFYIIGNIGFNIAALIHVSWILLFWFLDVRILFYFNFLSVSIFLTAIYLNRRGYHLFALSLAAMEIITHQTLCVLIIGWDAGFQYYIIMLTVAPFLMLPGRNLWKLFLIIIGLISFLILDYYYRDNIPLQIIDATILKILNSSNIFFSIVIIVLWAFFFYNAVRAEEERVAERTRQLEQANRRLKELDEIKSGFLSSVSHELRTPLTSILGFSKMISKRFNTTLLPNLDQSQDKVQKDANRVGENLKIIIDEGERLTRLINDVLDLAKIESGKMEWKMEEISLRDVVVDAVKTTSSLAGEKGLQVRIETKGEKSRVFGDRDRLVQVVTNLLSNSIKFTEVGSITCSLEGGEKGFTVKIKDTGIGIAQEDLSNVFARFKQVGDTLTDRSKGTGLGLPICKEIIEHHRGKIWAESDLGEGSTFIFTIPSTSESTEAAHKKPVFSKGKDQVSERPPKQVKDSAVILVVDDEANIRTLLRQELEGAGYDIIEAQDGNEALKLAREEKPDLIILDVLMPGLDGFDVARVLKQDEGTREIPIMIFSVIDDREKEYKLGVDGYLIKPVDPEQLIATVSSLVAGGKGLLT